MLTVKQEKFVQELVKGKTQREAYRIAYPSSLKWKDSAVDCKASLMLNGNVKVLERYKHLMREVEERTIYDAAKIRQELIETELAIIRTNPTDLFEMDAKKGRLVPKYKTKDDLAKIDGRAIKGYRFDRQGRLIIEFCDKQPAIETLRTLLGIKAEDGEDNEITIKIEGAENFCK